MICCQRQATQNLDGLMVRRLRHCVLPTILCGAMLAPAQDLPSLSEAEPTPRQATAVPGADEVFSSAGFNPKRDAVGHLPFEHVDPLNGNLLLTFTDLSLPGNAGFNLSIQRVYNSKIWPWYHELGPRLGEATWAGIGWTLHFGRIRNPDAAVPGPVEMPDGSSHKLYRHIDGSGRFITRDFWIYDRNSRQLQLPNGIVYSFERFATLNLFPGTQDFRYATRIADPFDNRIEITYFSSPQDAIQTVRQVLRRSVAGGGDQTRTVTFGLDPTTHQLKTMTYLNRTWTYTQAPAYLAPPSTYYVLREVRPPLGRRWLFDYKETGGQPYSELKSIETPNGGRIDYTFEDRQADVGFSNSVTFRVLARRYGWGRDIPTPGVWDYEYPGQSMGGDTSVFDAPCGRTTFTFKAVGSYPYGLGAWAVGLVTRVTHEPAGGGRALAQEDYEYERSDSPISEDDEVVGNNTEDKIYFALLTRRTQQRAGDHAASETRTDYHFDATPAGPFDNYARPTVITETGELGTRATERDFDYAFTPYIADRIKSLKIQAPASQWTEILKFEYADATGFKTDETRYGVAKSFVATTSGGNLAELKEHRSPQQEDITRYKYSWGVASSIEAPETTITRTINEDGTTADETRKRRGASAPDGGTWQWHYDALGRVTEALPPLGETTFHEYDNDPDTDVTWEKVRRQGSGGPAFDTVQTTNLDGYGRPTDTIDSEDIKTDIKYDTCGRKTYESYPFKGSSSEGTTMTYDALGRLVERKHADDTKQTYSFAENGLDVLLTNETQKSWTQDWASYGDINEAVLQRATEPAEDASTPVRTWSYEYNPFESLARVVPPDQGPLRTWTYDDQNRLLSESHPESGTITYTYYDNGQVKTRTDARFGERTFVLDGNKRTTEIRQAAPYEAFKTTFAYNAWDKVIAVTRTDTSGEYYSLTQAYDDGMRPRLKTEVVGGQAFVTDTIPDARDRLEALKYPSGLDLRHTYDTLGRLTEVQKYYATTFAQDFSYHPSGQVLSFRAGNNILHEFSYDRRQRISTIKYGSLLDLSYSYYDDGNIMQVQDTRPFMSTGFTYWANDLLRAATGFWGSGEYSYDGWGNRLSSTVGGNSTYTYETGTQRLQTITGTGADTFGYDSNGNVNQRSGATFEYGPDNTMSSSTVAGQVWTSKYDHEARRVMKVGPPGTWYYTYGPGGLISEQCATGAEPPVRVRDYIYAGSRLIASIKGIQRATFAFDAASSSVPEAAGQVSVTVRLSAPEPLAFPMWVRYRLVPGSAQSPGDYAPDGVTSGTITFAQGAHNGATKLITIPIVADLAFEPDETFTIELVEPSCSAGVGDVWRHQVTILDDDAQVAIDPTTSTAAVSEADGRASVTVRLTAHQALAQPLSVRCRTSAGTATSGADFLPTDTVLTFPIGATTGAGNECLAAVINDVLVEPDETFSFGLSEVRGGTLGNPSSFIVSILDDDPTVSFAASASTTLETMPSVGVPVVLTTPHGFPTSNPASVTFATQDGTAIAGRDYFGVTASLTFPAGSANGQVQIAAISLIDDLIDEPPQTFNVNLTDVTGGALGALVSHEATIEDNDPPPTMSIGDATVTEGDTTLVWAAAPVTLSQESEWTVSSGYSTSLVDTGTADPGTDFYPRTGRVTFSPGETSKAVQVPVAGDREFEGPGEWFPIALTAAEHADLSDANAVVDISDDDPEGVTAEDSVVTEGGIAKVKVHLWPVIGAGDPRTVSVSYVSVAGTASAKADYTAVVGDLTFVATQAFQWVSIPTSADGIAEPAESFSLHLTDAVGAPVGTPEVRVAIVDPALGTDFNGDGKSDLLWSNSVTGAARAWFINEQAVRIGESPLNPNGIPPDTGWRVAGTGSFQVGGRSDVLWRNQTSGKIVVWLMNGVNRSSGAFTIPDGSALWNWRLAGTGDFNIDGRSDVLWQTDTSGRVVVWFMNGINQTSGSFTTPDGITDDTNWRVEGSGDFNGDGRPDLFWRHQVSGRLVTWLMDGLTRVAGTFLDPDSEAMDWKVMATRDFNYDGRTDVLMRHSSTGESRLWLMDGIVWRGVPASGPGPEPDLTWQIVGPR